MRKWGIALDQATLQETAYSLGINKRVAEMTRAQKTELAYYQIMHATQYAQGNMARTLLTPASALRVVQTEFKQLGRAMGSAFIPMVMKVIPYVRALTQIFTELAKRIAAFFGFKISDYEFTAAPIQDIGAAFGDVEDNVNGATKALKKMLMPFDELNNVNFDTGGGSGGGIGGVGGGSLGLDTYDYDMFAGASDEINKKVEEIKNTFEKLKPIIIAVGGALAAIWAIDKIAKFKEWLDKVKAASSELSTVLQLALVIGGAFLIYKGIKRAIETDWDAKSLLMMIGGTGLIAAAGALKFKSAVPLQIGLGLSLALGGVWLLYKGIKKAIDVGEIDGQSFLEIISGGVLASTAGAILLKNPAMFKIGLGLTLALTGIAVEFQSVKKMLEGDISLGTILKATGNAFLIGLGVWLLTGSLTAGLLATAGVLAVNLGIEIGMAIKSIDWKQLGKDISTWWEKNVVPWFTKEKWKGIANNAKKGLEEKFTEWRTKFKPVENWWNEKVAPWFTKEKWEEIANNAKTSIETKFTEWKDNFKTIEDWWNEKIAPWFTIEKWKEVANNAKTGIETKFTEWKDNFKPVENWWNDKIAPWFTVEKWRNVTDNAKRGIETKFTEWKQSFHPIRDWWNEKVAPWFTVEKWRNVVNNAKIGIENKFIEWKQNFHPIRDWWYEKVAPWFSWSTWRNLGVDAVNGLRNAFSNLSIKFKLPHFTWTTRKATGWVADILSALSLPTSLPKLNVQWYAGGGFPKEGQIFGANENGPELIGNIGRRTAVANQQQITEGISDATYSAFSRALSENRNNSEGNPHIVVNIGDDKVYDGIARKENQYSNMYGVRL